MCAIYRSHLAKWSSRVRDRMQDSGSALDDAWTAESYAGEAPWLYRDSTKVFNGETYKLARTGLRRAVRGKIDAQMVQTFPSGHHPGARA
jgi:hypothetical protein